MEPERFDSDAERRAWKVAQEQAGSAFFASQEAPPEPSEASLDAVNSAAWRYSPFDQKKDVITGPDLKLAAILTVQYGRIAPYDRPLSPARWDVLIRALNEYANSGSIAVRFLVPALRNLVGFRRETPKELWGSWAEEQERLYDFTLHPSSPRFHGQQHQHSLVDFEKTTAVEPSGRMGLIAWQIRAHICDPANEWTIRYDVCIDPLPPISKGRYNELVTSVADLLKCPQQKIDHFRVAQPLFFHLLDEANSPNVARTLQKEHKSSLGLLNNALRQGLAGRRPTILSLDELNEYDKYLATTQEIWSRTERRPLKDRIEQRTTRCANVLGWRDPVELTGRVGNKIVGELEAHEAAALMLSAKWDLGLTSPQRIHAAVSEARKTYIPAKPGHKKRGRPPGI